MAVLLLGRTPRQTLLCALRSVSAFHGHGLLMVIAGLPFKPDNFRNIPALAPLVRDENCLEYRNVTRRRVIDMRHSGIETPPGGRARSFLRVFETA